MPPPLSPPLERAAAILACKHPTPSAAGCTGGIPHRIRTPFGHFSTTPASGAVGERWRRIEATEGGHVDGKIDGPHIRGGRGRDHPQPIAGRPAPLYGG